MQTSLIGNRDSDFFSVILQDRARDMNTPININGNRDSEMLRKLPRDIAINILSRLPIESIVVCKVVCKAWHDLIKSPDFCRHCCLIVFPHTDAFPSSKPERIYPAPYKIKELNNNNPLPIVHMGLHESVPLVRSSVNGLILLLRREWTEQQQQHLLLWVCNPITREYVRIPNPSDRGFDLGLPYPPEFRRFLIPTDTGSGGPKAPSREYGNYNFGFGLSRTSKQYKVVWISQSGCRVYTLGTTRQWKSITISRPGLRYNKWNTECAFVGGYLYWLDPPESQTQTEISCFDLDNEVFTYFYAPPTRRDLHVDCYRSMCVFDDCLCLCDVYHNGIEMWLLRGQEGGRNWSKKLVINEQAVSKTNGLVHGYLFPIKVLEDGGNGMLLGGRGKATIHYYSNDSSGGGSRITRLYPFLMRVLRYEYPCAAIYTPSFLPLRTLLVDEEVRSF
ncbi:hypothetical protein OROHE_024961 [Orobanche hederae]